MKRFIALMLLCSGPLLASTNQIDFIWDQSSPLGDIQAQGSSERDGLRNHAWSFDALHHISERLYAGMGIGHFRSADNNSPTFVANTQSTTFSQKTSTLFLGRMDLGGTSRMVPYVIAGVGWVKNSLTVNSDQGTLIDDSKSTLGYAGGVGIDFILGDRLLIGLETRYEGSPSQHFSMTPVGAAASGVTDVRTSMNLFLVGIKAGVKY